VRALAGLGDCRLAGVGGDVVEDLPEPGLDLGLGMLGDLGEEVAGAVKPERNNVPLSVFGLVGVVCAACA
jgi:hypothetical protein